MTPRFLVRCWSSPIVKSVRSTPGTCRMRLAIELAIFSVDWRLAPSGARTCTSNCDSSSCGRKFLFTRMNSGTVEMKTPITISTITQRCVSDQSRRLR